jgi:hypothetical protein
MPRAQTEMKGRCAPIANYNLHPAHFDGRSGYPLKRGKHWKQHMHRAVWLLLILFIAL